VLNSLQGKPCKFGSVELISNRVFAHILHHFFWGKTSLFYWPKFDPGYEFLAIFKKMFNPRVNTTLHNKKLKIFWSLSNFSTFILLLGGVHPLTFPHPVHPLTFLKQSFLHLVRECVRKNFCQFGEIAFGHCEDIARLLSQKCVVYKNKNKSWKNNRTHCYRPT